MSKNIPFWIARRYLFSKSNTNAINIISGISVFGLSIGAASLIIVFSIFNGFENVIGTFYNKFNPELKITPKKGKFFEIDSLQYQKIINIPEIAFFSKTIEEIAFFDYQHTQDYGTLKGVDQNFIKVNPAMDSSIKEGVFKLTDVDGKDMLVFGAGMRNKLSINVANSFSSVKVFMLNSKKTSIVGSPFSERFAYPAGTFLMQQDFNNKYVISSLKFAQKLLKLRNKYSSFEIKLKPNSNENKVKKELASILENNFFIKNRYEQEEAFYKIMNMEKWIGFAIISLMLFLIAFNLVGALWMMVLEKKKDISILKAMGATTQFIQKIFIYIGFWIGIIGLVIGFTFSIFFYILEKTVGVIPVPELFFVETYPFAMRPVDFIYVSISVILISTIASIPPVIKAKSISNVFRE